MVEFPDDIKKQYHIKDPKTPEMTVKNNIIILHNESDKMNNEYYRYSISNDEVYRDTILNSLSNRFNRYVQAFKDIVAYIQIRENKMANSESLEYLKHSFEGRDINLSNDAKGALEFISERNNLVHDYFNSAKLYLDLAKNIATYGKGYTEIADQIETYCLDNFPEVEMDENIKKALKKSKKPKTE